MLTTATPRFIPATGLLSRLSSTSGNTFPLHSPVDGSLIAEVPICQADDVTAAAQRARTAAKQWAATPLRSRCKIMLAFGELLLANRDQLLDIMQTETGKARVSAFEELADAAMTARYYAHSANSHLRERRRQGAIPFLTSTRERFVPKGVVGIIAPWNYPLTLAVSDAIPALLAGNGVVLKPDSQTPLTALAAVDLLVEAGVPADLFGVVTGPGRDIGQPLIDAVDYMMFTGSTATGRVIGAACGERLIGYSAELGGKNPMIVAADANLDRVVEGFVWAAFANSGQLCISVERLYIHDAVYDELVPRLVERVNRIRLGNGYDWSVEMGSLVSADQLAKVRAHIDDAVAKGATILAGGRHRDDIGPFVHEPTLLAGVTDDMLCARAETFGPVVAIYRVSDDEEAIQLANDSEYGLNASVWASPARGKAIARRLRTGTVNINEGYAAAWASHDAPMGGMGISGLGRRHGREGIRKFTESQTISVQRLIQIAPQPQFSLEQWADVMTAGVRLMRQLPFFK